MIDVHGYFPEEHGIGEPAVECPLANPTLTDGIGDGLLIDENASEKFYLLF
jgi:hypothetical protein